MISRILALSAILLLGGCASLPPVEQDADPRKLDLWQAHQASLQTLRQWRAEGRAAILAQNSGGQIAFDWVQTHGQQVLTLKTPLGQNAVQITQNPGGAVLVDQDGTLHEGANSEALLRETLGWSVPVAGMHAWLLGLPATSDDAYSLDEHGRLKRLHSQGWRIEYQRYTVVDGKALPSKMEFTHMDLGLRLVIDRWRL
ncbi:MAG: lipoprotein insertase outer membrane protein LolB [Pseudomonadota bacterium]